MRPLLAPPSLASDPPVICLPLMVHRVRCKVEAVSRGSGSPEDGSTAGRMCDEEEGTVTQDSSSVSAASAQSCHLGLYIKCRAES